RGRLRAVVGGEEPRYRAVVLGVQLEPARQAHAPVGEGQGRAERARFERRRVVGEPRAHGAGVGRLGAAHPGGKLDACGGVRRDGVSTRRSACQATLAAGSASSPRLTLPARSPKRAPVTVTGSPATATVGETVRCGASGLQATSARTRTV